MIPEAAVSAIATIAFILLGFGMLVSETDVKIVRWVAIKWERRHVFVPTKRHWDS